MEVRRKAKQLAHLSRSVMYLVWVICMQGAFYELKSDGITARF
jgi:hypothetical protein